MDLEKLREASNVLREAADSVGGTAGEHLRTQADELGNLADRERGPDHGRVARHQQKLRDIKEDEPSAADAVKAANKRLNEYRETVEGV